MAALVLLHDSGTDARRNPVVHLRVFKDRTYAAGVFLMTVLGFVLYGSLVLLPIFLQTLLGYPALQAGIAMAPRGLGSFLDDAHDGHGAGQVRSAKGAGRSASWVRRFWTCMRSRSST